MQLARYRCSRGEAVLTSLVVTAALSVAERLINTLLPLAVIFLESINFLVSFGVTTILFALILKLIPDTKIPWRDVWMGAAVSSLLFAVGKVVVGFYVSHSALTSAYGAAASVVIFLIWIYYSGCSGLNSRTSTRLTLVHEAKSTFRSD
jgi:membrane protein